MTSGGRKLGWHCPFCSQRFMGSFLLVKHLKRWHNRRKIAEGRYLLFYDNDRRRQIGHRVECWCWSKFQTLDDFSKHLASVLGGPCGHALKYALGAETTS